MEAVDSEDHRTLPMPEATPPEADEPYTWKNALIALPASAFMAAGGLTGLIIVGSALYHNIVSRSHWVETPCQVQQVSAADYGRRSDEVRILYHYTVEGQPCTSTRYSWWKGNLSHREASQRAAAIRRDPAPVCYVDPEAPQEAVFDQRILWKALAIVLPVGGIFAGLGLLLFGAVLWEIPGLVRRSFGRGR